MIEWGRLNPKVIAEFRENGGQVARFGGQTVVILHTIGVRSGQVREIPLIITDQGDQTLIFGTAAGAKEHPGWYYDLKSHPRIEVERGTERFTADVVELSEEESRAKIEQMAASVAQFAEYVQSAAPRVIPVFSINRLG